MLVSKLMLRAAVTAASAVIAGLIGTDDPRQLTRMWKRPNLTLTASSGGGRAGEQAGTVFI